MFDNSNELIEWLKEKWPTTPVCDQTIIQFLEEYKYARQYLNEDISQHHDYHCKHDE